MSDQAEPEIQVWLATEATDRRAMHEVIAVYTEGYTYVYESADWSETSPVDGVLAAAGFTASAGGSLAAREVPCDVAIVQQRGFAAPASLWPKVEQALVRALTGQLGGFFPVLAAQAFFHRSAVAFEYAWSAAGRPPVQVRHPELVAGRQAEDGTPGPVDRAAEADLRVASARRRPEEEEPPEEISDPWTRGPVEGEDPSPEELSFMENQA